MFRKTTYFLEAKNMNFKSSKSNSSRFLNEGCDFLKFKPFFPERAWGSQNFNAIKYEVKFKLSRFQEVFHLISSPHRWIHYSKPHLPCFPGVRPKNFSRVHVAMQYKVYSLHRNTCIFQKYTLTSCVMINQTMALQSKH